MYAFNGKWWALIIFRNFVFLLNLVWVFWLLIFIDFAFNISDLEWVIISRNYVFIHNVFWVHRFIFLLLLYLIYKYFFDTSTLEFSK
jgi:hypothetical protein